MFLNYKIAWYKLSVTFWKGWHKSNLFNLFYFQLQSAQLLLLTASSKHHQTVVWRHRWNTTPHAHSLVHRDTSYKVPHLNNAGRMDSGQTGLRQFHALVSFLLIVAQRSCLRSHYLCWRLTSGGIKNNKMIFADVDECSVSNNGGCSHKCVNTAGGYKCECPDPELSLSLDKRTCHGKYQIMRLLLCSNMIEWLSIN